MKFWFTHSLPSIGLSSSHRFIVTVVCVVFLLLNVLQNINAQTCASEKLTVRVSQINYSGTETGGVEPRIIPTATIGANSVTSTCFAMNNVTLPVSLLTELIINTQSIACGSTLPTVSVSFKAHEDDSSIGNCVVDLASETERTSATTSIDISSIRTDADHSITQTVTAGSGLDLWTITFEVIWETTVTLCSQTVYPNASAGFATGALAVADAGVQGKTVYNLAPNTTFKQAATVRTDANGTVGVINTVLVVASQANLATCSANTRATRTNTEQLFLKDVNTGGCTGSAIPRLRYNTNSTTFNPEWVGLLPNTDYIIFFTTTVDPLCYGYESSAVGYYGGVTPLFTFNCGTASSTGTFYANNIGGQTGTLVIPITGTTAGDATFTVSGTGFTGTLTTTLTAGQTSVTIPITYDGTGVAGNRVLTVTSSGGSGTCAKSVAVATPPTSFTYPFNCTGSTVSGIFIANAVTGQTGTVTIPINVTAAGSATITVTGTNISGTLTTTLVSGQSSVTIPITYTGAGTEGSRVLTISSTSGTGTCSVSVPIQAACKADGGRIGN